MKRSPIGQTAVLRVVDQRARRAPTHCVVSGRSTSGAVRVRAGSSPRGELLQLVLGDAVAGRISPRSFVTMLPVDPVCWGIWRRRLGVAVVVSAIGAGLAMTGIVQGRPGLIAAGIAVAVVGVALRAWFARVRWVGVRYDAERELVIVSRASRSFDDDAKRLFVAGVAR